jgi:hypothetical protein
MEMKSKTNFMNYICTPSKWNPDENMLFVGTMIILLVVGNMLHLIFSTEPEKIDINNVWTIFLIMLFILTELIYWFKDVTLSNVTGLGYWESTIFFKILSILQALLVTSAIFGYIKTIMKLSEVEGILPVAGYILVGVIVMWLFIYLNSFKFRKHFVR